MKNNLHKLFSVKIYFFFLFTSLSFRLNDCEEVFNGVNFGSCNCETRSLQHITREPLWKYNYNVLTTTHETYSQDIYQNAHLKSPNNKICTWIYMKSSSYPHNIPQSC